jgi:hypothetical protein
MRNAADGNRRLPGTSRTGRSLALLAAGALILGACPQDDPVIDEPAEEEVDEVEEDDVDEDDGAY